MNSYTVTPMVTYTVEEVKRLPAPSVKRLLRQAGYSVRSVGQRRQISHSVVSRVIRKQVSSLPVWQDIVWALNHPRHGQQVTV
jgi:hypothetical protein